MYLVSRTESFAKLFFIVSFAGLFMYVFLAFYTFHTSFFKKSHTNDVQKKIQSLSELDEVAPLQQGGYQTKKYILLWKINGTDNPIGEGQEPFIKYNCLHQNCFITTNKELLHDYTEFHAIVFNSTDLKRWKRSELPLRRSWDQKYVFFSKNSSEDAPICNPNADEYFNWTWSYKLHSDIVSPFFEVRNLKGDVVAPSAKVVWKKYLDDPIDWMAINKTKKTKAMVSVWKNCRSAKGLQMKKIYAYVNTYLKNEDLQFDIFGCENNKCDKECLKNITDNYFFYWVNDGTYAEDFVTDELMTAIETNTVPVLSGIADYSRFLPPGSYMNIKHMADEDLGPTLFYAIQNLPVYLNYFRWKQYYTINRTPKFHGLCQLCSNLNNRAMMEKHSHYRMFRRWWYPGPLETRCMKRETEDEPMLPIWKFSFQNKSKEYTLKKKEKLFDMVL